MNPDPIPMSPAARELEARLEAEGHAEGEREALQALVASRGLAATKERARSPGMRSAARQIPPVAQSTTRQPSGSSNVTLLSSQYGFSGSTGAWPSASSCACRRARCAGSGT